MSTTRKTTANTPCSPIKKNTEEEASLRHEGESSFSYSSERSNDNDEDDDGTGAKDKNCYRDGGGDRNTGARGGSAEWMGFLRPSTPTEALDATEKPKAPLSTKPRKKRSS